MIAPAYDFIHFNPPLLEEASKVHSVPGIKHNLLSMGRLVVADYTIKFKAKVSTFSATIVNQTEQWQQFLEGWFVPEEVL